MERTLVIIKPSAVQRGLVGEVISRFEKKGLMLTAMKMTVLTPELLKVHYAHLVDKHFYPIIEKVMTSAPVVLMCWEGVDAVDVVRGMTGYTNGRKAVPGTIRGDFSTSHTHNIIHTSDSIDNAKKELARFFKPEDYCEYHNPLFPYLYAEDEISLGKYL